MSALTAQLQGFVLLLGFLLLFLPNPVAALSMALISPGKSSEPYWIEATNAMQQAAEQLGVELEVFFAERNHLKQIQLTQQIAARDPAKHPNYLILLGSKGTLSAQLDIASDARIPTLLAFNTVTPADRSLVGYPREKHPLWLGSVAADAEEGGYLLATSLFDQALSRLPPDATPELIAIAGDRSSGTSIGRNLGLHQALSEFPQIRLRQMVFADWSGSKAKQQTEHLLKRYPRAQLVWAASDLLAYGAIEALALETAPRGDVFIGAINITDRALKSVVSNEFTTLAGGHHMAGAWAVVMLYDHYHGYDFSHLEDGTERNYSMFSLLTPALASQLLSNKEHRVPDFCLFSRACNPDWSGYDFSFAGWLDADQ